MVPRLIRSLLVLAIAVVAAACSVVEDDPALEGEPPATKAVTETVHDARLDASDETGQPAAGFEEFARSLPIAERAGQLVMTKLDGQSLAREERAVIVDQHLGGIILFAYNYRDRAQMRAYTRQIEQAGRAGNRAGIGMLISIDQEGGPIRRLGDVPPSRSHIQLGTAGDPALARKEGAATGRALRGMGINMNLAPVADLAIGPKRTMAYRSFGSDPAKVAPLVEAMVEGLQEGGVAAVPKHFPGFGGATANSDNGVAHVSRSKGQLQDDLMPYEGTSAAAVMVSHGIYTGLGAKRPATIAPQVIKPLLRKQLGYEGVAMTDSMNAKGLRGAWTDTVPMACVEAVKHGIDLVLLTGSLETATLCRRRIVDAVRDGTLSEERVNEAAARVLQLKADYGVTGLDAAATSDSQ